MLRLDRNSAPSHEDLFIERYERLRGRALQLTSGDQERAEDLLHDAFIHFTLNHRAAQDIHNLDAYLYTMLRNLYLSEARRTARTPQGYVSVLDYDLIETGLRSVDPRNLIKAQDELRAICDYGFVRKETSKAGSVLILRFFHGYYPSEIALILRTPRTAVDNLLKTARCEAKLYCQNPEALSFMRKGEASHPTEVGFGRVTPDILAELRHAIFQSRRGECPSVNDLERLFTSGDRAPVNTGTLAHVVSCLSCLDEINRLLGLPALSSRWEAEATAPDKRSKGGDGRGTGGGASSANSFIKRSRQRAKQVFEHRPKELRISVNGFVLGEQRISSELSELALSVNLDERIGFVEVYSEQDVRLFFLSIEPPPDGLVEQVSRVELSDGRALDLMLNFSDTWPKLRMIYHDPLLCETDQQSESAAEEFPPQEKTGAQRETGGDQSAATNVRLLLSSIMVVWRWIIGRGLWRILLRPTAVTVISALLIITALLLARLQRSPIPSVSAAELLRQSAVADETIAARTGQVIHRTISLEEKSAKGDLIARRRIDVWQSATRGLTVRRLYDERGRLIAGDWRKADGGQTIYRHGAPPQLRPASEQRSNLDNSNSPEFAEMWQLSPSATDFNTLIGGVDRAHLEDNATSYVISYAKTEGDNTAQGLLKATLVLSRADLHASEQTLLVRQGSEVREYRFVEASFERHAPQAVAPAVFDPDHELLAHSGKTKDERATAVSLTEPLSSNLSPPRVLATAALEVEVLRLLNQAGADLGEQVSVARTPGGLLKVQGIVETDRRKAEIVSALAPVTSNPAIEVEIQTVAEAVAQQQKSGSTSRTVTARQVEMSDDSIPVAADLRRYFGKGDSQNTEDVRRFASRVISRSSRAVSHAAALKRLINQLSAEDLRTLDPEARAKWLTLIRDHARAYQDETARLRQELQPIFFSGAPLDAPQDGAKITDDAGLARAIGSLFELGAASDDAIRSAFSISPSGADALTIKTPQFWHALREAEAEAERIQAIR